MNHIELFDTLFKDPLDLLCIKDNNSFGFALLLKCSVMDFDWPTIGTKVANQKGVFLNRKSKSTAQFYV